MPTTRAQVERLLAKLEAPVREALLRAVQTAQGRINLRAVERAVVSGDMEEMLRALGVQPSMYAAVTEEIRRAYMLSGIFILTQDLPKRLLFDFDINNPRAESWLRNRSSQLITGNLIPEQRGAIQEMLRAGMARGQNPRTTALDIVGRATGRGQRRVGGVIGLTQQQGQYVANAADDLLQLNPRYFDRVLRDKRFDAMVRESFANGTPLPKATRDRIVARYSAKMLKHRGDTIARTETLAALNAASDEALRQVVENGLTPKDAIVRIWRHSFAPNEREGHLRMNGQRRGLDEPFTNPLTGAVLQHPGAGPASEVINCRCRIEHEIDFLAVERAA